MLVLSSLNQARIPGIASPVHIIGDIFERPVVFHRKEKIQSNAWARMGSTSSASTLISNVLTAAKAMIETDVHAFGLYTHARYSYQNLMLN
jgi:hypothetical protein